MIFGKKNENMKDVAKAAGNLSLGISMVVAVLVGVFIGHWLSKIYPPLFWFGVFIGVAAAISNIYKAYKSQISLWENDTDLSNQD